jgi:hypothetical protein
VSGKFIAAVLLAASSASAATVGVVYTRLASPRHEAAAISVDKGAAAPLQSAVVLNASESLFEHESGEEITDPVCTTAAETHGCFTVMRSSDVRLNILGYTLTIPPLWFGGDSEDLYGPANSRSSWFGNGPPEIEFLLPPPYRYARAAKAGAQTDAQSDSQSGSQKASTGDATTGTTNATDQKTSQPPTIAEFVAPSTDGLTMTHQVLVDHPQIDDFLSPAPSSPDLPQDVAAPSLLDLSDPISDPTSFALQPIVTDPQVDPPVAPEPSTWLMVLTGMAALGWLSRRRRFALISGIPGPSA